MAKVRLSKNFFKYKNSFLGMFFGISVGFGYQEYYGIGSWNMTPIETEDINICFTPPSGCTSLIAKEIQSAKKSIYMHAYSFTSTPIIYQLKEAKKRGVSVNIILDSSNFSEKKHIVFELKKLGIKLRKDKVAGIAHNKIIIIDDKKVITGSFNFTEAADKRNAENVLLINDNEVASIYKRNWLSRKDKSTKF